MKAWEITESGLYVDDRAEPCFWLVCCGNKATAFGVGDWEHATWDWEQFTDKSGLNYTYNFKRLM